MHFFTLTSQQVAILLLALLSTPMKFMANEFERRAGGPPCDLGNTPDNNPAPILDGPTSDKSAGIGVEFEASDTKFETKGECSKSDVDKSKGKLVNNWKGPNWQLTADTTLSADLILDAE